MNTSGAIKTLGSVVAIGNRPAWSEETLALLGSQALVADDCTKGLGLILTRQPRLAILWGQADDEVTIDFIRRCKAGASATSIVVVAEKPDTGMAVKCVRAGAYDYITAPLDAQRLTELISCMNEEGNSPSHEKFFCSHCPPGVPIAGKSPAVVRMLEMIRIVAESRCNPILLLGETGAGKELAAQAVHAWRHGKSGRFIAVNCATLTANLLESELFGHVKGAFTGADKEKTGLLELADSGSIFLDEISEMPQDLQAKLLRFLQERKFRKVGGTKDISCSATIIASSNLRLFDQAMAGKFRKDLYYRLAVLPIKIAPLRSAQRRDDIILLAEYFLQACENAPGKFNELAEDAKEALRGHDWPGNVRELKNVIERATILEKGTRISAGSLMIERQTTTKSNANITVDFSLEAAEREFICRALQETNWQRTRAAALLGITRATLHSKIKRYDIKIPSTTPTDPQPQTAGSNNP